MNSFGRLFKIQIFGESHGSGVGLVIDGCPAGLPVEVEEFMLDMLRRQGGNQIGTTPRKEEDIPDFKTGVFNQTIYIHVSAVEHWISKSKEYNLLTLF